VLSFSRRRGAGQTRQDGIDARLGGAGGLPQLLDVGIACQKARFQRLVSSVLKFELLAQRNLGPLRLGQARGDFTILVLELRLQREQRGVALGALLAQCAGGALGLVETRAQRITFGMHLPGALDELSDTRSELI
jgi:hypothetical protein